MLLNIRNLSVSIDNKLIVDGVNLQIKEGEHHIILGPNGSGKTTLGKVIMGIGDYKIKSGEIVYKGEDITHMDAHKRSLKGIYLTFQHPIELEGIKSANMIWEALKLRGKNIDAKKFKYKYLKALEKVGLSEEFYKRELNVGSSGGERKKNELVGMLMLEPDLAILDEVDSGLDIESIERLAQIINEWPKALIIITHHPTIINYLKNIKIHRISDGKLKEG